MWLIRLMFDHAGNDGERELTHARRVQCHQVKPGLFRHVELHGARAAGAIHEYVDASQPGQRLIRERLRGAFFHDIGERDRRRRPSGSDDLCRKPSEQLAPACGNAQPDAFRSEGFGNRAANAGAGAGDESGFPG